MADFIPDKLSFISCKLFSSKESIDTSWTIIVLESASCSTWSILTNLLCFDFWFLYSCFLWLVIALFIYVCLVKLAKVVCAGSPQQFSRFFCSFSISTSILEVRHEMLWSHSMNLFSWFFTLVFEPLVAPGLQFLLFFPGVLIFANWIILLTSLKSFLSDMHGSRFQLETHYLKMRSWSRHCYSEFIAGNHREQKFCTY